MEFEVWLRRWKITMTSEDLSDRTIEARCQVVHQILTDTGTDPTRLTPFEIAEWIATKGAPATRHTYFCHLNARFRFLVRHDARVDNPMDKLSAPKRKPGIPRPIHIDDLNKVLAYKHLRKVTRDKILLGALAGLRVHEIAKISSKDIDFTSGRLHVIGKGKKAAIIPLPPDLLEIARGYPPSGYWFPSPIAGHIDGRSVSRAIRHAFRAVGVSASAHQLRHFYATTLVEEGVNLRIVQSLLRHESLNTTAIYTRVSPEQQRLAVGHLPSLKRGGTMLRQE